MYGKTTTSILSANGMERHNPIGTFPYASCRYVQLTRNFDTTVPVYGVKVIPTGRYSSNNPNVRFTNWFFDTYYWRVYPTNTSGSYRQINNVSYFRNVGGGQYAMFNVEMLGTYNPFYLTSIGTPSTCPYSQIWLLVGE